MFETVHPDLRSKVALVFQNRRTKNPRYSLRAFARDIGLNVAALSRFLAGKQQLKPESVKRVLAHVSPEEWPGGIVPPKNNYQFRKITTEENREASSVLHWTIVFMPLLKGFKPSFAWIADHLGTSANTIEKTVRTLFRIGWLFEGPKGEWLCPNEGLSNPAEREMPLEWRLKNLEDVQQCEKRAYAEAPHLSENEYATVTIAKADLEKAHVMIAKFREAFMQRFARIEGAEESFLLHTTFVPLTISAKEKQRGQAYKALQMPTKK